MAHRPIVVKAVLDTEAGVWFVDWSDLPGLNAEAPTVDAPMAKLPAIIADLLAGAGASLDGVELPRGLIASASTQVRIAA